MNFQSMQYFLEVAKSLNFTKAAERLFVSQPTLSRQIADLEEELGVRLLNRNSRTISLTVAGETFQREAAEIIERCNRLPEITRKSSEGVISGITIGFQGYMDTTLLNAATQNLSNMHPGISITLSRGDFGELNSRLAYNHVDIILTVAAGLSPLPNIECIHLQDNALMLAVPHNHWLVNKKGPIQIKDLANEDFVMLDRIASPLTVDREVELCLRAGFSPRARCYCKDSQSMQIMIGNGAGIAFIFQRAQIYYPETVKLLPIADNTPDFGIVLAYKKDNSNPALRILIDELKSLSLT